VTTEKKGLPIMPGLANPECAKRASDALIKRNECDYQAFMLLKGLVSEQNDLFLGDSRTSDEDLSHDEALVLLLGNVYGGDEDYARSWLEEVRDVLKDRATNNENFLSAVAGQPAR